MLRHTLRHFLPFQGIFMMYLYVGSIVAIMCIYISVLLDQCPSLTGRSSREPLTNNGDPESGSVTSFGTLRRAHIDRNKVSRTSFYLRVGALGKIYLFLQKKVLNSCCVCHFSFCKTMKWPICQENSRFYKVKIALSSRFTTYRLHDLTALPR